MPLNNLYQRFRNYQSISLNMKYQYLLSIDGGTFKVIWILGCKKDDRSKDKDLTITTICNTDLTKVAKHLSELLRGPRYMSLFLTSSLTSGTIEYLYIESRHNLIIPIRYN